MFHLTRRERLFVACVLLAFLAGLTVKHYRGLGEPAANSLTEYRDAKR